MVTRADQAVSAVTMPDALALIAERLNADD